MSTDTRQRILETAQTLIVDEGPTVSMGRIAEEAGITRRAVYLHFSNRSDLLLAVVDHVDETGPLQELSEVVWASPDARAALDEFVHLNAVYNPRIEAIALALSDAAATDEAAAHAWNDRMRGRRSACSRLVRWLDDEDGLAPDMSERDATDLLWALTGMRLWRDLVADRGWSTRRYERHVGAILRRTLLVDEALPEP